MRYFFLLLTAAHLLSGQSGGTIPRTASGDYPARATAHGVSLGAAAIAPAEARKIFGKDVSRAGYIVIEVAVYPESGQIELKPGDFSLRIGSATVGIAEPDTIIASMQPSTKPPTIPGLPGNVSVYGAQTIGYESGGNRRNGGVYTDTQVGVGVGGPGTGPQPRDPGSGPDLTDLRRQLVDKELPDTKTSSPIAGYIYFPRPNAKQKNSTYELVYEAPAGQVRVSVPQPPAK